MYRWRHWIKKFTMRQLLISITVSFCFAAIKAQTIHTDVLIVGGGTGGTAAGIQSARLKVKTIIAEPTTWLGGMLTAAGVSATDGNHNLPGGIWEEFRQQLYKHYKTTNLATGWVSNTLFEPHVGDSIFKVLCEKEKPYLQVLYGYTFKKALFNKNKIAGCVFINNAGKEITITSKICIDASETGEVIKQSNTAFDIGMEDRSYSGETVAPGKNNIIQDLTWAACLKDFGKYSDKTIARPAGYDSTRFFKSCISKFNSDSSGTAWTAEKMLAYGRIKNGKYMLNWPASGNDYYANVLNDDAITRQKKYAAAKNHTLQFVYFIQKDLGFKNLGLADDEFPTEDKLAQIPYNRESRRIKGLIRFTINDIEKPFLQKNTLYRTGISVGDYPVDHHHHKNPDAPKIKFPPIPSYSIPLGALIPQKTEGLIAAEKNISVSNIANGTTRLQPVVLLTGQAAGVLAAYCVQKRIQPKNAPVREIQKLLLDAACFLMPYADVKPADKDWLAIQKAGATGILRGSGKPDGWANKTFFNPDSTISHNELQSNIMQFIPCLITIDTIVRRPVTINEAWNMLTRLLHEIRNRKEIPHKWPSIIANEQVKIWKEKIDPVFPGGDTPITRRQIAILMNELGTHPFEMEIDWNGKVKN